MSDLTTGVACRGVISIEGIDTTTLAWMSTYELAHEQMIIFCALLLQHGVTITLGTVECVTTLFA